MTSSQSLVQQVGDLLKRVGAQREVSLVTDLAMSTGVVEVAASSPTQLDLKLERIPEGLVVRGNIVSNWHGPCARCLQETSGELRVSVDELFEREPIAGETYGLDGELCDLEPMVRDAVLLDLPQSPLCRPDCAGLCPTCGVDRNIDACDCTPDESDPRWSALGSLKL